MGLRIPRTIKISVGYRSLPSRRCLRCWLCGLSRSGAAEAMNIQNAIIDVLLLWIPTGPHEFAHAWVATRLGDDTPRLDGRVTLYPLAHVDWLGTAILPLVT